MGQKEKLIQRFIGNPSDFSFDELVRLLGFLGFYLDQKGRTSGSRILFVHKKTGAKLLLHRPHARKALLEYQLRQIRSFLKEEGLL